mmetsp:Transcript_129489/g.224970  ORF Transcript_129489/g.224970 Transcript_129489/m.224970 type:complete len:480 (+) Transcript_129489:97-1536(+)
MDVGGHENLASMRQPFAQKDADVELGKNPGSADAAWRSPLSQPASPLHKPASFALPAPASALPGEVNRGYPRAPGKRSEAPSAPAGSGAASSSTSLSRRGPRGPSGSLSRSGYNWDARSSYQRSRYSDNVVAMCMAGSLNLLGLLKDGLPAVTVGGASKPRGPLREEQRGSPAMSSRRTASAGRASSSERHNAQASSSSATPTMGDGSDPGASLEKVDQFGTGDNLVLQLRLFGDKDLFAFQFGCLVFWSFEPDQIEAAKESFKKYMVRELPQGDIEEETMPFVMEPEDADAGGVGNEAGDAQDQNGVNAVRQDQIVLKTTSPYERLAHSYALAQSVRLGVYENAVDRSIADTRSIPETMAERGEVDLDSRQLSRQMGGLLMLRCDVNLHTDILDTPEIFWDEDRFEPHYMSCRGNLDVDKRVEILNQRLGVLKDLYDLLQNGLNVRHGNRLEVIIIILILVEVLLELVELVFDKWGHK